MRKLALVGALAIAGCATSEQYVSGVGTYDLCRLTMGGPHSVAAENEARRRGIDCAPLYPTIQATEAARTGAALQYLQMNRQQPVFQPLPAPPQQTRCTTRWDGAAYRTVCQ